MSLLIFSTFLQCQDKDKNYNNSSSANNIEVIKLPNSLNEVSGLAISDDGNLFCHNDEIGVIYQIDPSSGKIIKNFQLGAWGLEADFEDIAIVGDKFFLITSNGILYEFSEGSNLEKIKFDEIDLNFSSKFEIEGLCYDPSSESLLIACKDYSGKNYKGMRAVYSFSLKTKKVNKTPRFLISLKGLKNKFGIKKFFPSAVSREPNSGNFFVLSSKGNPAIVELDSSGTLVSGKLLDKKMHPQPEGLAFNKNGDMLISNESVNSSANIIIYKYGKK